MAVAGYKTSFFGAVRTGYLTPQVTIDAMRAEVECSVQERPVRKYAAGVWEVPLSATLFGSTISEAIMSGYVKAATEDIPFVGPLGGTVADRAEILLCSAFAPVANAGADSDRLARADLRARMSSREPLYGGQILYYADNATGVTGDTFGAGVSLGAIPAGSEGVFPIIFPHWPTMGGTAAATVSLQHSSVGSTTTLDAGPAVDNGGGLVGIPSTGHGFTGGQIVRIIGTTNYDGENLTLDGSTSANELVITATYVAETFAGTETVDDLWDSPTVAVEQSGTNPFALATGTPAYTVITLDGDTTAITDTEWRIVITSVTATAWPFAAGAITTKDW